MAVGWTARTTAVLAVAAAALSGCSNEQPANDTLPEASAETSATTDALPPLGPPDFPVPDEAREKTPEGALEFTRYYIDLIAFIGNGNLDATPMLQLSDNCEICSRIAASFEADRSAGYTYAEVTVSFSDYAPARVQDEQAEVEFIYSQSALTVLNASGAPVISESAPATGNLASGAHLYWSSTLRSWVVTTLTIG